MNDTEENGGRQHRVGLETAAANADSLVGLCSARALGDGCAPNAIPVPPVAHSLAKTAIMLHSHSGPVYGLGFARNDAIIVSVSQDGSARLWGVAQRACLVRYQAHASPVWSVAFSPFGPYFATCGYDRSVRLWRVDRVEPIRVLVGHLSDIRALAFHPNVSLLGSGSDDSSVRVWDLNPLAAHLEAEKERAWCARLLRRNGHCAAVTAVAISPCGVTLASTSEDRTLNLWDLPTGMLRQHIVSVHSGPGWTIGWSQEGSHLVTAGRGRSVAIWDGAAARSSLEAEPTLWVPGLGSIDCSAAATAASGKKNRAQHFIARLYTKRTPVLAAQYSRANLLLVVGALVARREN